MKDNSNPFKWGFHPLHRGAPTIGPKPHGQEPLDVLELLALMEPLSPLDSPQDAPTTCLEVVDGRADGALGRTLGFLLP